MLAIVAPGQGSQKPGMLASWLELDGLRERAAAMSERTGLDLIALGTTADADEIKDTAVTQPLVVAASLLAAERLTIPASAAIAGHSVGELAAAALAGVLPVPDAVELAAVRGKAMGVACGLTPTGMSAVMGGDPTAVIARLAEMELVGANVNGGGQIVAAGSTEALAALAAAPPEGTRVIPLPVAGAFHTAYMATAEAAVGEHVAGITPDDPRQPLVTNSDGGVISGDGSGAVYLNLLVAQVTRPVRWDRCMETLRNLGVTGLVELPPAGTLVGLARRELKGVATFAVKTPEDLDAVSAFFDEHAGVAA